MWRPGAGGARRRLAGRGWPWERGRPSSGRRRGGGRAVLTTPPRGASGPARREPCSAEPRRYRRSPTRTAAKWVRQERMHRVAKTSKARTGGGGSHDENASRVGEPARDAASASSRSASTAVPVGVLECQTATVASTGSGGGPRGQRTGAPGDKRSRNGTALTTGPSTPAPGRRRPLDRSRREHGLGRSVGLDAPQVGGARQGPGSPPARSGRAPGALCGAADRFASPTIAGPAR